MFNNLFPKTIPLKTVWKNTVESERSQMTIRRMLDT
jgi:hypothetical protein